jgi:hypothetical protein
MVMVRVMVMVMSWGGAVRTSAFCRGAAKGSLEIIVVGVLLGMRVLVFSFYFCLSSFLSCSLPVMP